MVGTKGVLTYYSILIGAGEWEVIMFIPKGLLCINHVHLPQIPHGKIPSTAVQGLSVQCVILSNFPADTVCFCHLCRLNTLTSDLAESSISLTNKLHQLIFFPLAHSPAPTNPCQPLPYHLCIFLLFDILPCSAVCPWV